MAAGTQVSSTAIGWSSLEPDALEPHGGRAGRDPERLGDVLRARAYLGGLEDPRAGLQALALDLLGEPRPRA